MGHFQSDLIANDETDEAFAHFAGDMSEHFVAVAQFHAKHRSREHSTDDTVKLNGLVLVVRAFFAGADLRRMGSAKTTTTGTSTATSGAAATTRTTPTTSGSGTVMSATTLG